MSLIQRVSSAQFSKVKSRVSWNANRTNLVAERLFGLNQKLSSRAMAPGEVDALANPLAYTAEAASFGGTVSGNQRALTSVAPASSDQTFVVVCTKSNGGGTTNYLAAGALTPTPARAWYLSDLLSQFQQSGGSTVSYSISALTADKLYFFAVKWAASSLRAFYGKAGVLTAVNLSSSVAWTGTPTEPISFGGDRTSVFKGTGRHAYGAIYTDGKTDSEILEMYLAARDVYLPYNSDF